MQGVACVSVIGIEAADERFEHVADHLHIRSDTQRALLRTAQARLNSAQTRLARRKIFSPVAGSVQQIYYRGGQLVPSGKPIVAILPPGTVFSQGKVYDSNGPMLAGLFTPLGLTVAYGGILPDLFLSRLREVITVDHFIVGMVKAPFMAFVIGTIACVQGLAVEGSAESLGQHTTDSVVHSIFFVIVLDGIFAIFFASIGL